MQTGPASVVYKAKTSYLKERPVSSSGYLKAIDYYLKYYMTTSRPAEPQSRSV